jgi:predicted dehydrogenase
MPGVEQTGNSVMTALVTGDPTKATKLAEKYSLKSYSYEQFDQLLKDDIVDALYIATPNFDHRRFAVAALKSGHHVLLEKPMEISEEYCQEIINAQKESGAKLMVAYRLHCEPGTLDIIDRVRSGAIGDLLFFNSTFTQPLDPKNHRAKNGYWAGPVPDIGTYQINAVRNLFGAEPLEVRALGVKTPNNQFPSEFDDTVAVTLLFPGNKIANFVVSYRGKGINRYEIVGTEGNILVDPGFGFEDVKISYKAQFGDKEEEKEYPSTDHFSGETHYFSECIIKDLEVEPDGEEGWLDIRVEAAIERALTTGEAQKLEPYERKRRPSKDQARSFPQAKRPDDFIGENSDEPSL